MSQDVQDNYKYSASQLSTFSPGTYLERTARPVYAMAYLLGFLIFYEISVISANPDLLNKSLYVVNGGVVAFVWVQNLLHFLGFNERLAWLATPVVVIIILTALQIASRRQWKVYLKDFLPMTAECILMAAPLIVFGLILNRSAPGQYVSSSPAVSGGMHPLLIDITTAIGAGIYEELVFRLVLMCLLMFFFETVLGLNHKNSIVVSIIISASLFSLHHNVVFLNGQIIRAEVFTLPKFVFRMLAGVYFAVIFAARGFGITAGTHVFYDIIVMTILR
ncbi:MAG: CPBP family intramembrane metalloprotease [Planctomycetes bacterium]|nr:CPBP family intramembrane metalloprotease [Planctomycetota bacterium]